MFRLLSSIDDTIHISSEGRKMHGFIEWLSCQISEDRCRLPLLEQWTKGQTHCPVFKHFEAKWEKLLLVPKGRES